MNKKQKRLLVKILTAAAIYIFAAALPINQIIRLALYLTGYLIVGGEILLRASGNILRGQVFDENFLMSIATIGAFCLGAYPEGIAVMLFYQVGELFQSYAVHKSRKSIAELMDIRPDYANVTRDGLVCRVSPEEVAIGEVITVKPGEKIPLDGTVLEGHSALDTSALTGESVPQDVTSGDPVTSGCINISGILKISVTKEFAESTVSKILDLVENASSKKAEVEAFITRFARYYTPVVVIVAAALAVIPPLLFSGAAFSDWIYRALTFLVISCPCALVLSVPLSFFGGIGGASKCGILIKGANYLESLANTQIVVFDKTGTLTKGSFEVTDIQPVNTSNEKLLELAAYAESYSNHPISVSIQKAFGKEIDTSRITDVSEIAGYGIKAAIDGQIISAGNSKLMEQLGAKYDKNEHTGTVVHLAAGSDYLGCITVSDKIKPDAKSAINGLKAAGIKITVMLTGDLNSVGQKVAKELGIDIVYSELLPADKVERMEKLIAQKSNAGKLVFVGDGINDAPVLARADIGVAMGGLGSDAAIEAADVVIMTDEPSKLSTAIKISKNTLFIAKQNIVFALTVKGIILMLGAIGFASMWAAVFADVGVTVIAVLNATRALRIKKFLNKAVNAVPDVPK